MSRTALPPTVTIAGCPITVSDKLMTLGITLDAALTFKDYVKHVAKACNMESASYLPLRSCSARRLGKKLRHDGRLYLVFIDFVAFNM